MSPTTSRTSGSITSLLSHTRSISLADADDEKDLTLLHGVRVLRQAPRVSTRPSTTKTPFFIADQILTSRAP
jgi:hypothetical protein